MVLGVMCGSVVQRVATVLRLVRGAVRPGTTTFRPIFVVRIVSTTMVRLVSAAGFAWCCRAEGKSLFAPSCATL